MPNAMALLALHQLQKLERFNAHRRVIAHTYAQGLKNVAGLQTEGESDGRVWLRYSILVGTSDERRRIMRGAKAKGILLGDWYDVPIAPPGVDEICVGYATGSCPNAERVAQTVINLPTHIGISQKDAKRIISVIKDLCR